MLCACSCSIPGKRFPRAETLPPYLPASSSPGQVLWSLYAAAAQMLVNDIEKSY